MYGPHSFNASTVEFVICCTRGRIKLRIRQLLHFMTQGAAQ
jgi:hypothetical protein